MRRPPPRSTLFPYTTLFRSFADVRVRQALTMAIDKRPIVRNVTKLGEPITSVYVPPTFPTYKQPTGLPYDVTQDRKSTRLNSSHMSISYAVFCLNKKTRGTH